VKAETRTLGELRPVALILVSSLRESSVPRVISRSSTPTYGERLKSDRENIHVNNQVITATVAMVVDTEGLLVALLK
jgi:hypothetical protein